MKLREYHPLSEMERVPVEDMPERLDELFERIDRENVGFVLTREGKDAYVLSPYKWYEPEYETVEVEVDAILLEQLKQVIEPMGLTPEELIVQFFYWCANPDTQEEAIAWLKKAKAELEAETT